MLDETSNISPPSPWTDERIEKLKTLCLQGLSNSQIAAVLGGGLTRNAVIGKAARLKLPGSGPHHNVGPFRPRMPAVRAPRVTGKGRVGVEGVRRARAALGSALLAPEFGPSDPVETIVDIGIVGVPLLELTDKTCRWPVGDPKHPDFTFCGHPPVEGSSYCAFHRERSIGSGTPAERAAA